MPLLEQLSDFVHFGITHAASNNALHKCDDYQWNGNPYLRIYLLTYAFTLANKTKISVPTFI